MNFKRIEILEEPDNFGRYVFFGYWDDPNPAHCLTCGTCSTRGCNCYDMLKVKGQIFRRPLTKIKGG
jgi:hypothetical protein